jgi:hypothetical protein
VSCLSPNGPWMGRSGSPGLAGGDTKSLANGHGLGTNSMLWSRRLVGTHVRLFVRSGHKPTIELMGTVQNSTVQYRTGLTLTVTATVVGFGFLLCCVSVPLYLSFLQFLPTNISLFFIGRIFLSDVSYYGISYQTPCMLEWR